MNIPPLRERKSDIPLLVQYVLKNLKEIYNTGDILVDDKTLKWIQELS